MKTIEEKIATIEENLLNALNALNKLKEEINTVEEEPYSTQSEDIEDEELFSDNPFLKDFFENSKEEGNIIELNDDIFTPLKFDLNTISDEVIEEFEEKTLEEFIDDFFIKSSMILSIHKDEIINIYKRAIEFNDDRLSVTILLLEKIAKKREIDLPTIKTVEDKEELKEKDTLYKVYYNMLVDRYKKDNKSRATKKAVGLHALNNQKGYSFLTTTLSSGAIGQELVDLAVSNYAIIRGVEKLVSKEDYTPLKFDLGNITTNKKDEVKIGEPKSIEEKGLTLNSFISDELTDKLNELKEVASKFDLDPKAILKALLSLNPRSAVSMNLKIGFFNVAGFSKYAKELLEILESEDITNDDSLEPLDTTEELGIEISDDLARLLSVSREAKISPDIALEGKTEDEDLNRYINLVFTDKKEGLRKEFDNLKRTIRERRLEEV